MLSQEAANGALAAGAVVGFLLSIGLFLMSKGLLRARHWVRICFPLSMMAGGLAYFSIDPVFSTWTARIIASAVNAVLLTATMWILLLIFKADVDQWDKKPRK
jgi:hypothetical protein